ncbi:MAG: MarR family transcriptional regulator [Bacillota bacterium]|nr:MarR family transcriptional regulator [Bacillota bacterium]
MFEINNEITESFLEINKALYRLLKKDADQHGVTVVQLKAMFRISNNPDISLGDLAEKLRLTNSTVSGVIDRLVHNGFVERIIPPENRRSISLHLTEKGHSILADLHSGNSILVQRLNAILELPDEEIQHLLRLHRLVLSKLTLEEDK